MIIMLKMIKKVMNMLMIMMPMMITMMSLQPFLVDDVMRFAVKKHSRQSQELPYHLSKQSTLDCIYGTFRDHIQEFYEEIFEFTYKSRRLRLSLCFCVSVCERVCAFV